MEAGDTASEEPTMTQLPSIQLDCCSSPSPEPTPFAYDTPSGEWWELLFCSSCRTHWCHATDRAGVQWFTPLLGKFQPTPALKLGPRLDLAAVRRRQRTLRVTSHAQEWIDPPQSAIAERHFMDDSLVERARETAIEMHDACGHFRSDGTPYWTHPQRVVSTLASYGQPPDVLAAAWLHDVAEDCCADEAGSRELLERFAFEFGPEVAALVTEVTNFFGTEATMEEKQARLREHARAMSDRAKWIKLADRLDNISGMVGWSREKRKRYATSTLLLLDALKPWPIGAESLACQIADAAARHG
jgi:hypothetical protein